MDDGQEKTHSSERRTRWVFLSYFLLCLVENKETLKGPLRGPYSVRSPGHSFTFPVVSESIGVSKGVKTLKGGTSRFLSVLSLFGSVWNPPRYIEEKTIGLSISFNF